MHPISSLQADPDVAELIELPDAPADGERAPFPLVAALVPVGAAVALWGVTGSILMLWFAVLGPLIAVASIWDNARARRRSRKKAERVLDAALLAGRQAVGHRHTIERAGLMQRHPDVAGFVTDSDARWRSSSAREGLLVVGRGTVPSSVVVRGGRDVEQARTVRRDASKLLDAPITVALASGVAVVGPPLLVEAVARAFVMQVCLALPPDQLHLLAASTDSDAWLEELPHRRGHGSSLLFAADGVPLTPADFVIARVAEGSPPPARCAAVLTVVSLNEAILDVAGQRMTVAVEALSMSQTRALVGELQQRASGELAKGYAGESVELASLLPGAPPSRAGSLAAVLGREGRVPCTVDLVSDGPHAVVTGMTGAGKSELLTTWISALCATHSPQEVTFLLADFKGGTAFERLRALPHVVGVLTDLDDVSARRAVTSLRAELRRREALLAEIGMSDIAASAGVMSRLVIVVDEFAALLDAHPDLSAVFTDVAARGRALGMHLILGTQRATGVVRDALLANCPLRICLRVAEVSDSRLVIGTDEAARLPGTREARGLAYVRRAGDVTPTLVRIAVSAETDRQHLPADESDVMPSQRPWLPPLPLRVSLDELRSRASGPGVVLGIADEPERQRQPVRYLPDDQRGILIVGGPGSGKSSALALIRAQLPPDDVVAVPENQEAAWDAVAALSEPQHHRGGVTLIIDNIDALLGRFSAEYAAALSERLERIARDASGRGLRIIATTQRVSGSANRITDTLAHRIVLPLATRADHVAAGAEPSTFSGEHTPGRAVSHGTLLQLGLAAEEVPATPAITARRWLPAGPAALVVRAGGEVLEMMSRLGIPVARVDDPEAEGLLSARAPAVVWGEPESWQREWHALGVARRHAELVISAQCQAEYRALTGSRELPPYCQPGADRGWQISTEGAVKRVSLSTGRGGARRSVS